MVITNIASLTHWYMSLHVDRKNAKYVVAISVLSNICTFNLQSGLLSTTVDFFMVDKSTNI